MNRHIAGAIAGSLILLGGCTMPPEGGDTMGAEMDAKAAALVAVGDWATAWAEGNVDGYLAAYAADYAPAGMSHDAWVKQRTTRLQKPGGIELQLSNQAVELTGEDTAVVTFDQDYRSASYADTVKKALTLKMIDGAWKIVSEETK